MADYHASIKKIAAEKAARDAAAKAAEEAKTTEELAREEAEREAAAMLNYRTLSTDQLREECKALGLDHGGFLLLPRILKGGIAAAALINDSLRLKSLIRGVSVVKANITGHIGVPKAPPLFWTVRHKNLACCQELVTAKADIDHGNVFGTTPAIMAARCNQPEILKLLIDSGANYLAVNKDGYSALTWAATSGFKQVLALLVEMGADLDVRTTAQQYTPLLLAGRWGHREAVTALVAAKANLALKDKTGYNVLHLSSKYGHEEVVKLLLDLGLNKDSQTNAGHTPLLLASEYGHTGTARILLDRKANHKKRNGRGHTALMRASALGHLELVELLLSRGAQARVKTIPRRCGPFTPLSWAAREGHIEVVKRLLEAGADVENRQIGEDWLPCWNGLHAFNQAASKGHMDVVKLLARSRETREREKSRRLALIKSGQSGNAFT